MFYPIPSYDDVYQISEEGIIISKGEVQILTPEGIISGPQVRRPYKDKNGYLRVSLKSNGKAKTWGVHQLVMLTFVGDYPSKKHHINHKDWDTSNPSLNNLEYILAEDNNKYKNPKKIMPSGENHHHFMKRGKLSKLSKRVGKFQDGNLIEEYESLGECARKTGYNISNIWCTIHGTRQNNCHGYQFKYL